MWEYSLILCPLSFFILLYVIILLKKTYIKTQIIFNIPFIPALLIQYFIATKIDQYYYMSKDLNKNISEFYSYIFNSEFIFYHIKIGIIYILLISLFFYIFKGINLIINKYKKTKLKEDNYESV
jgi:hypothetical protein